MCLFRSRALAGCAMALLSLVGPAAAAEPAPPPARYLRIQASQKCVVYLQFQGDELRASASAAGLSAAAPMTMLGGDGAMESPEFTLPVPAVQLPDGITAVKGRFGCVLLNAFGIEEETPGRIYGDIELCRRDERGAGWACVKSFQARPAADPAKAPVIAAPDMQKLTLALVTAPSEGRLGIGLKLMAGDDALSDVRKDGRGVLAAEVWALDDTGSQAALQRGRLSDFGFGWKGAPNFSVALDKGGYTVEAKLDAGPFGVFKVEAQTSVP